MNLKQIIIMIAAVIGSALILWYDLPIEFPGVIFKVFILFVKLSLVIAVTIVVYIFAGRKKAT